jgi:hypothetical protein
MTARKIVFSVVTSFLLVVLIGTSPAQVRRQNGSGNLPPGVPPSQFNPEQFEKQMQAEAAERSRQLAAEGEQRRAQMLKNIQQNSKETERQRDESIKRALGATDQQWEAIFPRFDKVRTLMRQARYSLATIGYTSGSGSGGSQKMGSSSSRTTRTTGSGAGAGGGAGGSASGGATVGGTGWKPLENSKNAATGTQSQSGWKWARPSDNKGRSELNPAEKAAEEVLDSLEKPHSNEPDVRAKLAALRKIREQAAKQLPEAQKQLREVLNFEQEAKLVLMGYLE